MAGFLAAYVALACMGLLMILTVIWLAREIWTFRRHFRFSLFTLLAITTNISIILALVKLHPGSYVQQVSTICCYILFLGLFA